MKTLFVLMQELNLRLQEIEFFKKQATPPPIWYRPNFTRPYPSISISLIKTVLSRLIVLNPITALFVNVISCVLTHLYSLFSGFWRNFCFMVSCFICRNLTLSVFVRNVIFSGEISFFLL